MRTEIRSIGFDLKNKEQFKKLALHSVYNYDTEFIYNQDLKNKKVQRIKYFGDDFGIVTISSIDEDDNININSVQPYFETSFVQRINNIKIKNIDTDINIAYGVEEYSNIMVFFFIQNNFVDLYEDKNLITGNKDVKLYGLSSNAKVILPNCSNTNKQNAPTLNISDTIDLNEILESSIQEKMNLIDNILENFENNNTMYNDLDISNIFAKLKEYIHYVGKNTYEFLGTIQSVETAVNKETNIKIFKIVVDISGIFLDVLVNEFDLYGLPILGMRLLGTFKFCGEILKDS